MDSPNTFMIKVADVKRNWRLVDAKGRILGEVAVEIANALIGKDKVTYSPHVDGGDYVVVINAGEVEVTRTKTEKKMYYRHSGFPGGIKQENFSTLRERSPRELIERAVNGMLPKNKLQTPRLRRMKVFRGAEHDYNDKFGKTKVTSTETAAEVTAPQE